MSFLRPEVQALLLRWREPAAAAGGMALALWLGSFGGWFFVPLGALIFAASVAWGIIALRRMRFRQAAGAPGLVELDEGQIGYLGPEWGGFVALDDLEELRLVTIRGERHWRLAQSDGQVLAIPVGAEGAERLFDAFATLPGFEMRVLLAALDTPPSAAPTGPNVISLSSQAPTMGRVIWRRPARAVLT
ncbi:hypothetical protein ORIO_01040 [Cereibacter azotoformans]|uniref:Uncharacterized protein n=1 Tax=Cereibacter sphaeroides (strain ATCC 17025 / ATH 2.4.3) TaxID=349102 RepID=A4WP11_CERS5|nr:hypothetical protein [Cereibacter azotoformans]ULB08526.1 hypothetical protein ORIO_01040 [Cereibacter azotoformans]